MALVTTNSATFDGVDLTTVPGLTVLGYNPYAPAKRNLTVYDIARTSKAKVNSGFYNKRELTLHIGIAMPTRDLAEQSLDTLMGLLQGIDRDLVMRQSGGLRKYSATYSDFVILISGGSYIEGNLIFETSDHFGYDVNDSLLAQVSSYTSAQKTTQLTVGGSAAWQVPKTTITLVALSGSTTNTISFGNDATGQTCAVTRGFTAGDVLVIDALAQIVTVNGTEVAFTSAIPEWAPGVGYVTYSDNFTSRTVSFTMVYKRRFV